MQSPMKMIAATVGAVATAGLAWLAWRRRSSTEDAAELVPESQLASEPAEPPSRGLMVLLEGMDLAGKTTAAKQLKDWMESSGLWAGGVGFSRNYLARKNEIAKTADVFRKEPNVSFLETGGLYLAAHLFDAQQFRYPKPDAAHVQESSWLRTLAFNRSERVRFIPDLLSSVAADQPRFDLIVFLTADIKVRQQRLKQREAERPGENDALDALVVTDPERFLKQERLLLEAAREQYPKAKLVVIDTTALSKQEVLNRLIEQVKAKAPVRA